MKRYWCKTGALLLTLALAFIGVPGVVTAQGLPQFSVSATEGRPGLRITAGQIDPCPPSPAGYSQFVEFSFTDAAGKKVVVPPWTLVEEDGRWIGKPAVMIPWQRLTSLDPVTYTKDTPPGIGQLEARCFVPSMGTTQEYEPRPFLVTGPTPRFSLSSSTVRLDTAVRIEALYPCPAGAQGVDGLVKSGESRVPLTATVDSATGLWHTEVVVPTVIHDPMFGDKAAPLGNYSVSAWCRSNELLASYGDELLKVVKPPVRYVALGDSVSAGEGTFDYYDTANQCHRSRLGYPPFIAQQLALGEMLFAACSGAVTDDFYMANPSNPNELAQLSRLNADTEVVTLTIGGNDAGFAHVLNKCIQGYRPEPPPAPFGWGCSKDDNLRRYIDKRLKALNGQKTDEQFDRVIHTLAELYRAVHRVAPNAKIYVGGYPHLFGEDKSNYPAVDNAPSKRACPVGGSIYTVDFKDARWINVQADRLNSVIRQQVSTVQYEGVPITYVQPLFKGNSLCDEGDPWINDLFVDDNHNVLSESFHPWYVGYDYGYGIPFIAAIRASR